MNTLEIIKTLLAGMGIGALLVYIITFTLGARFDIFSEEVNKILYDDID